MINLKNRSPDTLLPGDVAPLLLGESVAMLEVFRLIDRVGPTDAAVLLAGESGSGKDLTARSIHARSARHSGPFIAINCGAIPTGLIEAELFGDGRSSSGSDVGAEQVADGVRHPGVFERARGGTLFLDEITEMPFEMQSRLLQVLETRTFYRSGSTAEISSDLRIIAATSKSPLQAVQSGQLREDLLYRLAVFPIDLPPLRARGNDVELLAEHFLDELNHANGTGKRLSAQSRMTLKQHAWPGNVRELRNCVERAFILNDAVLELVPIQAGAAASRADSAGPDRLDIRVGSRIHDMERSLIVATLDYFQGNKRRAADALGCSLKTLYNKLNGYSQSQECPSG